MDIIQQNVYVYMERPNLLDVPQEPLPPDYSIRWFRPGDEQVWVEIQRQAEEFAEVSEAVHRRVFGNDARTLGNRQCFLLDHEQTAIATATAWFDDYHGDRYGRVHWVAVVPEYQGRGLAKPLMSIVLTRMIELGHDRVCLRTSSARLPAIGLYTKFGFVPSVRTEKDYAIWKRLGPLLPTPLELPRGVSGDR
jgi:GNAT superfamily N-acetyltransferase